jgi:glycosyltransferase involved in cell wall biosynthesis
MRLLHVIDTLAPSAGGTSEAVRLLTKYAPAGEQQDILCCDAPEAEYLQAYRGKVYALGSGDRATGRMAARVAGRMAGAKKLQTWLREHGHEYDAVVAHGLWNLVAHATRRGLRGSRLGARVPYAIFVHGMLDPYFKRTSLAKHAKKWTYWLATEYWTLRAARRVLFTTQIEADLAQQSFWLHRWQAGVVPLGSVPLAPATEADHDAFLECCPEVRGRRFLLFLGRIHPKKGVDLLVTAFAHKAAAEPVLDLVIAGPPSPDHAEWIAALKREAAAAGVSDRIHWPGMIVGAAKRGALDLCEAFVLTSHQENFGIAVVEALAAARPVLLTYPINIAAEIAAEGAGFVESDTLPGAELLLSRWLALSAGEREAMNAVALRCFDEHFDMRVNAARLGEFFSTPPQHERAGQ